MKLGTIFADVGKGIEWCGKEAEDLTVVVPKDLSKLIVLSADAKTIASAAADEVITLSGDVSSLIKAVAKDDGASLKAIEALIAAGESATAAKGFNFTEDAAVVTAVEAFFATINGTNYADVLTAIAKIIADGKSLSSTVLDDFEKLKTDATS